MTGGVVAATSIIVGNLESFARGFVTDIVTPHVISLFRFVGIGGRR